MRVFRFLFDPVYLFGYFCCCVLESVEKTPCLFFDYSIIRTEFWKLNGFGYSDVVLGTLDRTPNAYFERTEETHNFVLILIRARVSSFSIIPV